MTRTANRTHRRRVGLTTLLAVLSATGIDALQCITPPTFVTSDIAIYTYGFRGSEFVPLPAARVQVLHATDDRSAPIASGTTDDNGFLRLSGLPAGKYLLVIDTDALYPYLGSLQVTGTKGKRRVLGAQLDESCPLSCIVNAGAGADAELRACFQRKVESCTMPSNKELKLTKPCTIGASQLNSSVSPTIW